MKVLISFMLTFTMGLYFTLTAQNTNTEQLIVFIQDGRSISQDFKRHALPEIEKLAEQNGLTLRIVDASDGAPAEVTYTPAIFYGNEKETTQFNGRYYQFGELAAFVNSKGKDQPEVNLNSKGTPMIWNIGRATMGTTMHINPLSGKPPRARKFNSIQFEKDAMAALKNGMKHFRQTSASQVLSSAKLYHMEFYPEVKEGVLLVHMELYSILDGKKAVYKSDVPSGNQWDEWQTAFEKAGNRLERTLIAQISSWDNGDGFDTLKASTPTMTWGEALSNHSGEPSDELIVSDRD